MSEKKERWKSENRRNNERKERKGRERYASVCFVSEHEGAEAGRRWTPVRRPDLYGGTHWEAETSNVVCGQWTRRFHCLVVESLVWCWCVGCAASGSVGVSGCVGAGCDVCERVVREEFRLASYLVPRDFRLLVADEHRGTHLHP